MKKLRPIAHLMERSAVRLEVAVKPLCAGGPDCLLDVLDPILPVDSPAVILFVGQCYFRRLSSACHNSDRNEIG
jgi:hypothetical protein